MIPLWRQTTATFQVTTLWIDKNAYIIIIIIIHTTHTHAPKPSQQMYHVNILFVDHKENIGVKQFSNWS